MCDRKRLQTQMVFEFHRLIMQSGHLVKDYATNLGLQERDGEALLLIWQAEIDNSPISPSDLADGLQITRAAVSYLVDRLEKQGYVERIPDPNDRRKTRVKLSANSADIGHSFIEPLNTNLKHIFNSRTDLQMQTFIEMLSELTEALRSTNSNPSESAEQNHRK